jgi:uncharacterized membrane protein
MVEQRNSPHWDRVRRNAYEILNVRSEITRQQSRSAALVEGIGRALAHPMFFIALLSGHVLWVVLNLPIFPWFRPWDPYPFIFLATFASAEAPFVALLILMYQKRSSRISELREELNLQVSLHQERQMTVVLRLLGEVQDRLDIASREDPALLDRLQKELDPRQLMQSLRSHLQRDEHGEQATAP